ncbi:MAG: hypothetical protein RL180_1544 [Pseudomonadota bacterium]
MIPRSAFRIELSALLQLMWPILLTQTAQAGFGLIDTIMAGQVSPADLAAVAIGAGLWLPAFLMLSGILMATTPLVAEAVGAGQSAQIPVITRQALWVAVALGWVGFALLRGAPVLFDPLDIPVSLQAKTSLYLQGVAWGMPAVALYTVLRGYTEALGQPRPVTVISFIALALSVPLNHAFIYGFGLIPALGGAGCGYATAIMMWCMLLMLALYVSLAPAFARVRVLTHWERPNRQQMTHLLTLGIPIGVAIFFEASMFCIAALVLSPLGETIVAGHQIALSITSMLFMIPLSLAMALTIRVGHVYGEGDLVRLRQVRRLGLMAATGLALLTMLMIGVFRHDMARAYTPDADVQAIAAQLLLFALAYQLFDAWQVSAAGILRGLQDTRGPMWITLFCYWVVALPLGVWLARGAGYGANGFWLGLVLGLVLASVLLAWRLHWRQKQLLLDAHSPAFAVKPVKP